MASKLNAPRLRELFSYDPATGVFTRKLTTGGALAGTVAGNIDSLGYVVFRVDGKSQKAHRLAWLYVNGEWPVGHIDHIDNCRSNNRIDNLRQATRSQNKANSRLYSNNSSGFKGVRYHKPSGKWQARIGGTKRRSLGYFSAPEQAHAAYVAAANATYGDFARAG